MIYLIHPPGAWGLERPPSTSLGPWVVSGCWEKLGIQEVLPRPGFSGCLAFFANAACPLPSDRSRSTARCIHCPSAGARVWAGGKAEAPVAPCHLGLPGLAAQRQHQGQGQGPEADALTLLPLILYGAAGGAAGARPHPAGGRGGLLRCMQS